jgi:flagellar biosynthetic protein FliQ
MNPVDAIELVRLALWTVIMASAPAVLPAMIVGLAISLFQALTQIQENTLTFVPKIMVVILSVLIFSGFIGGQMQIFMAVIFDKIRTGYI